MAVTLVGGTMAFATILFDPTPTRLLNEAESKEYIS